MIEMRRCQKREGMAMDRLEESFECPACHHAVTTERLQEHLVLICPLCRAPLMLIRTQEGRLRLITLVDGIVGPTSFDCSSVGFEAGKRVAAISIDARGTCTASGACDGMRLERVRELRRSCPYWHPTATLQSTSSNPVQR